MAQEPQIDDVPKEGFLFSGDKVTVNITTPGTLGSTLFNLDVKNISMLTIKGALNSDDLKYISSGVDPISTAESIDLSGVTLIPGGGEYATFDDGQQIWRSVYKFYIAEEESCEYIGGSDWLGNVTGIYAYKGKNFAGLFANLTNVQRIVLPEGITEIGPGTFSHCENLLSVNIPSSVTAIKEYAFYYSGIESLTFEGGVKSIGDKAFYWCPISKIVGAETVETIGNYAFAPQVTQYNTKIGGISEIDLSNVTTMGVRAFEDSGSLKLKMPKLTNVPKYAFCWSDIGSVELGPALKSIDEGAFGGCGKLTSVTLPDDLTRIGKSAFAGTPWLQSLTPYKSVVYIGRVAYAHSLTGATTSLTFKEGTEVVADNFASGVETSPVVKIVLPESLTYIGKEAFFGFKNLKKIEWNANLDTIAERAFLSCSNFGTATLPQNIRYIGKEAFRGCNNIFKITLPESLTYLGENAFGYCSNLKEIEVLSRKLRECKSFNSGLNNVSITIGKDVSVIPTNTFASIDDIAKIFFDDRPDNNPIRIEDRAFYNLGEQHVDVYNIPKNIPYIGSYAFCKARLHDKIDLAYTDTISLSAFLHSIGLGEHLIIPENVKKIYEWAFGDTEIRTFEVRAKYLECGHCLTWGAGMYGGYKVPNTTLTKFIIGKDVEEIGNMGYNCIALEEIEFEERPLENPTPLAIGPDLCWSEENCLTKLAFPNGTTSIEGSSLCGPNITEIILPESFHEFGWDGNPYMGPNLKQIVCYAKVPPKHPSYLTGILHDSTYWDGSHYQVKLMVPAGCKEAYVKGGYKSFIIEEMPSDADIDEVTIAEEDAVDAIYNLSGQAVNDTDIRPGIYIVKYKSGRTAKVVK